MEELIQTYIPSTVKTCIDVGIPLGVHTHDWHRLFPVYRTIELLGPECGTVAIGTRTQFGYGDVQCMSGNTCSAITLYASYEDTPRVFVLNGDRTISQHVPHELSNMYSVKCDTFVEPSSLQQEVDILPDGSYVIILNPSASTYEISRPSTLLFSSESVEIIAIDTPATEEPVVEDQSETVNTPPAAPAVPDEVVALDAVATAAVFVTTPDVPAAISLS